MHVRVRGPLASAHKLHDAPQPARIRWADEAEQGAASREEDGQTRQRVGDVRLVDARLRARGTRRRETPPQGWGWVRRRRAAASGCSSDCVHAGGDLRTRLWQSVGGKAAAAAAAEAVHTLSSHTRFGASPAHSSSLSNLTLPSSDHECDANASTLPSVASTVFACIAGSGLLSASSARVRLARGSARKRPHALASVAAAPRPPMSAATEAASCSFEPCVESSRPSRYRNLPRLAGLKTRAAIV
jgi:hypothetical protein